MNKEKLIIYSLMTSCMVAFGFISKPNVIKNGTISPMADTSSFTPNAKKGWGTLSSYLNQVSPDSVEFGLILKQSGSVTWGTEQFVGTITNKNFLPKKIQKVSYDLYRNNTWSVTISSDGLCYISQLRGDVLKTSTLPGSPFVLPVKVRYKNN